MEKSLSRKERRQMEEQRTFYRNMKKRAAVLGTTVTAVSAVAPLSPVITVLADESDTYIEQTTRLKLSKKRIQPLLTLRPSLILSHRC